MNSRLVWSIAQHLEASTAQSSHRSTRTTAPPPNPTTAIPKTMSPPTNTKTFLMSGTTRGIGRGLVSSLLQHPNTTVIAGVRGTKAATATSLNFLPKAQGANLIIVKIDASPKSQRPKLSLPSRRTTASSS